MRKCLALTAWIFLLGCLEDNKRSAPLPDANSDVIGESAGVQESAPEENSAVSAENPAAKPEETPSNPVAETTPAPAPVNSEPKPAEPNPTEPEPTQPVVENPTSPVPETPTTPVVAPVVEEPVVVAPLPPAVSFATLTAKVLKASCVRCHQGPRAAEGVDLSSPEKILAGSAIFGDENEGAAMPLVVVGKPEESLLWKVIEEERMPLGKLLNDEQKAILKDWILTGAKP